MEAHSEIPEDELEALRQVARSAEELCTALEASHQVTILGSDFELQFRALERALGALLARAIRDKEDWGSVAEDWRLDAPGG